MFKTILFSISILLIPTLLVATEENRVICFLEQSDDFFKGRSFAEMGLSRREGIVATQGEFTNSLNNLLQNIINDKPADIKIHFNSFSWIAGAAIFSTNQMGLEWLRKNKNVSSCDKDQAIVIMD